MTNGPMRVADLTAAQAWSRARFMDGCARFGPRFVRLGVAFAVIEGAIALAYATAVVQAYRGFVSVADVVVDRPGGRRGVDDRARRVDRRRARSTVSPSSCW